MQLLLDVNLKYKKYMRCANGSKIDGSASVVLVVDPFDFTLRTITNDIHLLFCEEYGSSQNVRWISHF